MKVPDSFWVLELSLKYGSHCFLGGKELAFTEEPKQKVEGQKTSEIMIGSFFLGSFDRDFSLREGIVASYVGICSGISLAGIE